MRWRKWVGWLVAAVAVGVGGYLVWRQYRAGDLPAGFTQTHGRIEATRVDVAAKSPGRLVEVLVREGDTVEQGQVVAKMDTRTLKAQLRQAEAQTQRARDAKTTATAVAAQRESEWVLAKKQYERSRQAYTAGAGSKQDLEIDQTKTETAAAALGSARSQVIEAQSAIEAAAAEVDRLKAEIDDCVLAAPIHGRVQYRLAEPGEVLAAGGRVLSMIDLTDVYMICYLPEAEAGRTYIGAEARFVLDAAPTVVAPATVSYVAAEAQFTPKTVETATERQKLAFQVRVRIDRDLLRRYEPYVKAGIPGVVTIRLDPNVAWPDRLAVHLPPVPPGAPHP